MVDIALISDKNFINQVIITITSLYLNSNKNVKYNIYVLCNDVDLENQQKLKSYSKDNINIYTIDAQDYIKDLPEFKNGNWHVNKSAIIKFYLPIIFKDLDKILYLDSDILILKDLDELNNIDIKDYYISAVVDGFTHIINKEYLLKHKIYNKVYFNSGVMLLNLKKMRENNITEKLIDYRINNKTFCMDQDALNFVMGAKFKKLDYKYNLQMTILEKNKFEDFCKIYNDCSSKNKKEIIKNACILHFADERKPWIFNRGYYTKLYKYYYKKAGLGKFFPKWWELKSYSFSLRKIIIIIKILMG